MDVWSIADELLKSGYLIFLKVDQKVLSEGGLTWSAFKGLPGMNSPDVRDL